MSLLTVRGALVALQGPGEHGRQHHRAILQRGHLHPGHRGLRRFFARNPVGDLTLSTASINWVPSLDWLPVGDSFSRTEH